MRRLAFALVVVGVVSACALLLSKHYESGSFEAFAVPAGRTPAHDEAAEKAIDGWLSGRGLKRLPPGGEAVEYEGSPTGYPLQVAVLKGPRHGGLRCRIDWRYEGYSWFRDAAERKVVAFRIQLASRSHLLEME